jgi:hypothetical protein
MNSDAGGPRFPFGRAVITLGAKATLDTAGMSGLVLLARHTQGDWGDLSIEDLAANELALLTGGRLLSSYNLPDQVARVWIITEADRSVTTVLLPNEY